MPKADNRYTTSGPSDVTRVTGGARSRRGAPLDQPNPDALLIGVCAEMMRTERESCRLWDIAGGIVGDGPERLAARAYTDAHRERMKHLEQIAFSTRAVTIEGIRAKAAYAATFIPGRSDGDFDPDSRIPWSVLQDLLTGSPPDLAPLHPDAGLIHLGAKFDKESAIGDFAWARVSGDGGDEDHDLVAASAQDDRVSQIVDKIRALSAKTLAGVLVKLRAMMWCRSNEPITSESLMNLACPGTETHILVGMLTDLHAMQGASA